MKSPIISLYSILSRIFSCYNIIYDLRGMSPKISSLILICFYICLLPPISHDPEVYKTLIGFGEATHP